ncbi:MAG: hypothetical protein ACLSAH_11870 [Bilophila wadsworthia]
MGHGGSCSSGERSSTSTSAASARLFRTAATRARTSCPGKASSTSTTTPS